ncbi:GNAT family N-acetyltransferase [Paenibacillus cymbidii]|uniref:GNAT family N-acetyltransferase n=1 Tax=Paenibacillus cymbidii TaxID=1639034 RepID=UPI00107FE1BC|nr:GNAT family N-acetyltransferase [Paenibacillus cymbidii]
MSLAIISLRQENAASVARLLAGYWTDAADEEAEKQLTRSQLEDAEGALFRLLRNETAQCFVAKLEQEFVGFMMLAWSFSSKGGPVLRVEALYTSPRHRNGGIGRQLMEHAFAIAKLKGACRLQLETDEDNATARALYERLGFELLAGKRVYMAFL